MGVLKDMGWDGFRDAMRRRAREACIPLTGAFELTPLCNFRCRMCYVRLDPEQMAEQGRLRTADEWLRVAEQAAALGTYRITLTGGEVLTRPDFAEIYLGLIERGIHVSLLSNGSLVDEGVVALLREHPPLTMRFTLYGASNGTYERLCGVADGFDRVMRGLRLLADAGLIFSLAFTETTENVDDLDGVIEIAKTFGTMPAVTANLAPAVRGAESEAACLQIRPESRARDHTDAPPRHGGRQPVEAPGRSLDPFSRCTMHRSSFWIDWNGTMEPCGFMSFCRSRPFEQGFETAWRDMHEKLAALKLPARCMTCPDYAYCDACPGLRDAMAGSPVGITEELCRCARERHEAACAHDARRQRTDTRARRAPLVA